MSLPASPCSAANTSPWPPSPASTARLVARSQQVGRHPVQYMCMLTARAVAGATYASRRCSADDLVQAEPGAADSAGTAASR